MLYMLTSQDIKLLIDSFKTRAEADEDLRKLEDRFDLRFNDVLDKLDAVYKELKDMRQEQDFHVQQHRDINDRLDKIKSSVLHA